MKKILIYHLDGRFVCHVEEPDLHLPKIGENSPIASFDVSEVLMCIK